MPGLPGRAGGELRVPRLRPHPARLADRLLRRHRRRLVQRRTGGPPEPALRGARRAQRRRRGHGGAGGLRGARGAGRTHRPGRRGGRARRRHARPAGDRRPLAPGDDGSLRRAVRRAGRRPLRAPATPGPRVRRHRGPPARPTAPGRASPRPLHVLRRPVRGDGHAVGRRRRRARLCGQRRVDRPVARHGTPAGHRLPGRDAREGARGPGAALAPRGPPGRRLRLRHRARPRASRPPRRRPSPSPSSWRRPSAPAGWCRPPTRSPASRTPWSTPARRDGGAR